MTLAYGTRTPACSAMLLVALVASNVSVGAAASFLLVQTNGAGALAANITLAWGFETALIVEVSAIGAAPASLSLRQWLPSGLAAPAQPDTAVPATCGAAAAAPVCYKPSGSWTSGAWMWVYLASATPGAFLYVTTDGTAPRTSATATFVQVRGRRGRGAGGAGGKDYNGPDYWWEVCATSAAPAM